MSYRFFFFFQSFVPLSLLLVGMARGQEEVDVASLNANGDGPLPCWTLVDANFDRKEYSSFEGKNASKWFKLGGSYGWCGADNCCDFHPKGQCNPPR